MYSLQHYIIKDEVLITVGSPIFPSILIAKYLFTGSLKYRSIDNLETQKKYISMKKRCTVGKMNGTAVTSRLQNSFKITCPDHRIIEIL